MTVAVGDARARDAPALASTQTQGKIQPRESSLQPTSHHRARSPSDSGSDTTEAGDAANPIQRTPDARSDVVLLKDVAAGPKGGAASSMTPPTVNGGNGMTHSAFVPPSEPASGVPTPMIATDGAVKKPTGGMYGVASSPHSPNSALGLDGGADLGPSSGDPSDEECPVPGPPVQGAEGADTAVQNEPPGTVTMTHAAASVLPLNGPLSVADERARAACVGCFRSLDDAGRAKELRAMGQRELQETFRTAFNRTTTSNNNQWLRRRIAGCMGIEAGAVNLGAGGQGGANGCGARPIKHPASIDPKTNGPGMADGAGSRIDESTGVRKSSRAAKPKILDFLPSAVCVKVAAEAPGDLAIGRRIRVFRPEAGAFFVGSVSSFNAKNGKHVVKFKHDDADRLGLDRSDPSVEVLLAAERIEWILPGEDEANGPRGAPATAAGSGALSSKARVAYGQTVSNAAKGSTEPLKTELLPPLTSYVLPSPGKPAVILSRLPPNWPQPNTHVWGRVKGHGWWPGVVVRAKSAEAAQAGPIVSSDPHSWRHVKFFDDTAAAVHRHDLVPFGEYVSTLKSSKKSATYARALTLASASYEKGVRKGVESGFDGVCTREMLESKVEVKAAKVPKRESTHKPAKAPKAERRDSGEFPPRGKPSFDLNAAARAPSGPAAGLLQGFNATHPGIKMDVDMGMNKLNMLNDDGGLNKRPLALVFDDDGLDDYMGPEDDEDLNHPPNKRRKGGSGSHSHHGIDPDPDHDHHHGNRKLSAVNQDGKPFKRSHKKGQGIKARLAAEAAGLPWPPPKPEGFRMGGKQGADTFGRGGGGAHAVGRGTHGVSHAHRAQHVKAPRNDSAALLSEFGPHDQLGALSRKLDALQTRVVPLAIAASQHLRRQLQLAETRSANGGGMSVPVHPTAMMTERERDVLLEEMRVLQRLLTMAQPGSGDMNNGPLPLNGGLGPVGVGGVGPPGRVSNRGPYGDALGAYPTDLDAMLGAAAGAVGGPGMGGKAGSFSNLGGVEIAMDVDSLALDADPNGHDGLDLGAPGPGGLFGGGGGGMNDDEEDGDIQLVDGDVHVPVGDDALGAMLGRELSGGDTNEDNREVPGSIPGRGEREPVITAVDSATLVPMHPYGQTGGDVYVKPSSYGHTVVKNADQTDDEDEDDEDDLSTGVAA